MGQHRRHSGNSDKSNENGGGGDGGGGENAADQDPGDFDQANGPWPCGVAKGQLCVLG